MEDAEITAYDEFVALEREVQIETLHRVLLIQGRRRFGEPDAATKAQLKAITDLYRLESLIDYILTAVSWNVLLSFRPPERLF